MFRTRAGRRSVALVAGATAALIALTGCAPSTTPDDQSSANWEITDQTPAPSGAIDSYTWAVYAEPYSLDYAYAFDYPDNQVLANVCESLLRLNPDLSLSPGLAESYEQTSDLTWVYTIREGVKFHDGTSLTADDVVASMQRIIDPAVGSSWYSAYQNVASIVKTGDMEVTVTTTIPDSQFNQALSGAAGVIESAASLTQKGADYGNSTGLVNCTGPFELSEWNSGESITLTRFDDYWDDSLKAKSGEVKFVFMNDGTARVNALKSGDVDGTWMLPYDSIDQLQQTSGEVHFGVSTTASNLIISNLDGPLGDLRVRQALLMALDRQGIVDAAAKGYADVSNALTQESVWGGASEATREEAFTRLNQYSYDVEAAKKLVEEAGATGEKITIATAPFGNEFNVISQATAAAAQSIGLEAEIETVTANAYTALFSDPSAREGIDLFFTTWYTSTPDALEMYGVLQTGEFSNYGNWSDADFDEIAAQAVGTFDSEERAKLTSQLQHIANEQLPWLPLYTGPMTMYMNDRITGASPSIAFLYYPWAATIGAR